MTDLVSRRGVFLRGGKAYVPAREELSLVQAEFTNRLSRGLEVRSSTSLTSFNHRLLTPASLIKTRSKPPKLSPD